MVCANHCPQVVAPRSHLILSTLLSAVAGGALAGRVAAVPLDTIQPAILRAPHALLSCQATAVKPDEKRVECRDDVTGSSFSVEYDKLIIATGAVPDKGALIPGMAQMTLALLPRSDFCLRYRCGTTQRR